MLQFELPQPVESFLRALDRRAIADFKQRRVIASLLAVPTAQSFHGVFSDEDGIVTSFGRMRDSEFWVNAGFFCLRPEIFDYIEPDDELVEEPFQRLIALRELAVYRYLGFWKQMDTFKDKIMYDRMEGSEDCPWMVWKQKATMLENRERIQRVK